MQRLKDDYRKHVVLYALIIIPTLVLVMSSSSIFADVVPGGGDGGSVYTETWTASTTTTTNSSTANTSQQKVVATVDGKDIVISIVIGGTSIFIGRVSNSRRKSEEETRSDSIMLAGDLDVFTPELKDQLLKDIKNELDKQRRDRVLDAESLKEHLDEFEKLKRSPYFDDAIRILNDMREELTLDNLQEKVEDLEKTHEELKDLKQCSKCNKPAKAIPLGTDGGVGLKHYRHPDPLGGRGHDWYVLPENDKSAWDHWRMQRNLPTTYSHCKCAYCGTMHRRNDLKASNGLFDRFIYGTKFKCQNPKCGHEQWVPNTNRWEDETVAVFVR